MCAQLEMLSLAGNVRKNIYSFIKLIILSIVLALLINRFVIINANVPSESMLNTIGAPSRNIALRPAYLFSEPQRYDIVVFPAPDTGELYVKRIVGLPGEKIEIHDGNVYINEYATPLEDSFVEYPSFDDWGPRIIPDGHYFMLGDNRINSHDSRKWDNTYVHRSDILGKILFSYYPEFRWIE